MQKLMASILMLALLLSPALAGSLLAADTTPPAPPAGIAIGNPEKVDPCTSFAMISLPLNWPVVDPTKQLGWITPKKQEGSVLCWAATTEMALGYHGTNVPQCKQVDDEFYSSSNPGICCQRVAQNLPLTSTICDRTDWNPPNFNRYGFHVKTNLTITDWSQLQTYICLKQSPFIYFSEYNGGGEHTVLVYGYDGSVNHVFIVDPDNPATGPSLDTTWDFDTYFKGGVDPYLVHTRDYVDICPNTSLDPSGSCQIVY